MDRDRPQRVEPSRRLGVRGAAQADDGVREARRDLDVRPAPGGGGAELNPTLAERHRAARLPVGPPSVVVEHLLRVRVRLRLRVRGRGRVRGRVRVRVRG
jgi:hypothetical protein